MCCMIMCWVCKLEPSAPTPGVRRMCHSINIDCVVGYHYVIDLNIIYLNSHPAFMQDIHPQCILERMDTPHSTMEPPPPCLTQV